MIHERLWDVMASTDQRIQVSPDRIRIPDLVVLRPGTQRPVLTEPPLLTVEILSPDGTYSDLEERSRDYLAMGVENIWIIDPGSRTGRSCVGPAWIAADQLEIPATQIFVHLPTLFSQIDVQAQPR